MAADEHPHDRAGSHDNQKRVVAAQDDLAEASLLCDRCAILDAGAILQNEPASDVLRNALGPMEEPLCRTGVGVADHVFATRTNWEDRSCRHEQFLK